MVTICDHLFLLCFGELEKEILRKTPCIALDGLVERLGRNAVNRREVGIEQDFLAPDRADQGFEGKGGFMARRFRRRGPGGLRVRR